MKCSRCGRQFSEDKIYAYEGKAFCDDCLMEIGLHARKCEPWASYLAGKERPGRGSIEGLTEQQKQIYDFIKEKGKATRNQLKKNFKLSEAEMDAQLLPLMHSELVKERPEKDGFHFIVVA